MTMIYIRRVLGSASTPSCFKLEVLGLALDVPTYSGFDYDLSLLKGLRADTLHRGITNLTGAES